MVRESIDKVVAFVGVIIFLVLIALGYFTGVTGFVNDSVVFILLILFFYLTFDKWKLSTPVFAFMILSFIPHNLGIFGYYSASPIFLQWDHFSHFMPMMAFSMIFFNFLNSYMDKKFSLRTFFIVFIVLCSSLGIGAIIEKFEFMGFMMNGFGEGGFAFGAGDACAGQIVTSVEDIDAFGGGWFNTMWDLVWNFFGALSGVLIMCFKKFV